MVIAVNTRVLSVDFPVVYREFVYETFNRIVGKNPNHQFVFISDRKHDLPFIKAPNVTEVVTGPATKHPLLLKFWFNIKVPAVLRKYKADVFVSCEGIIALSTKLPQCMLLQDLAFLQPSSFIPKSHISFYKKSTPKFLATAKSIVTTSAWMKQAVVTQYNTNAAAVKIIPAGADENFNPINEEEKSAIKNKYTEGKEFFLYTGDIHPVNNILNLLKAFSIFKKRQQTGMKLILAGKLSPGFQAFKKSIASYKYRNDVVWLEDLATSDLIQITAAAYGLINISLYQGFNSSILQAMRCAVPVIITADSSMQDLPDGAVLFTDANDIAAVADKMKMLYKDENLRKELIQKGSIVASEYNWDKTAGLFWESICKAIT
jgi:glycosyltransferase involved in cell wall biosynthesis